MLDGNEQNVLDSALYVQKLADEIQSYGQRNFDSIVNSQTKQAAAVFLRLINMRRLYAEALETVFLYYSEMKNIYVQGAITAEIPHHIMKDDMEFLEQQYWHYLALRWDNGEWFIDAARYIDQHKVPVKWSRLQTALSMPEEIFTQIITNQSPDNLRRLLFKTGPGNSPVWSQIQDWYTKELLRQKINGK